MSAKYAVFAREMTSTRSRFVSSIRKRLQRQLCIVWSVTGCIVLSLSAACTSGSNSGSSTTIMEQQQDFVGKWKKVSTTTCAETYPDEIEFFAATFLGQKG